MGEYHSFHADVLLPQGNYAARIEQDGIHTLIYSFYFTYGKIDSLRVLPPPKQLDTDEKGRLVLKSYYRWNMMIKKSIVQPSFTPPITLFKNPTANLDFRQDKWTLACRSGYEICCFKKPSTSFMWEGTLTVEGMGKLGLVCDADEEGNGYFISLDVANGIVQIRAWGYNPTNDKSNFVFNNIQTHLFASKASKTYWFRLIRYGHYIEFAIDDIVKLTLIDYTYQGEYIGIYSASSVISLHDSSLHILPDQVNEYASQENAALNLDNS
jgi:beta-fructofuranosidase